MTVHDTLLETLRTLARSRSSLLLCLYYPSASQMKLPDIFRLHCSLETAKTPQLDVLLHSHGGDFRVGYKAVGILRDHLSDGGRLTAFVPFFCLSAATLLALGADELVLSDTSWLGPIDPQFIVTGRVSGSEGERYLSSRVVQNSLHVLREYLPENAVSADKERLFADAVIRPLTTSIDPYLIAGSRDYEQTVFDYGVSILSRRGIEKSMASDAVRYLISRPTHDYVIDRFEIQNSPLRGVLGIRRSEDLPEEGRTSLDRALRELMAWERRAPSEHRTHPYIAVVDGRKP